jgi:hypothetical protein
MGTHMNCSCKVFGSNLGRSISYPGLLEVATGGIGNTFK